jgi:hypothetical protein
LAATGATITDQASLDAANGQLERLGFPLVKIRPAVSFTQSGVNAAAAPRPFSYPSVDCAIGLISPSCWLAKSDLASFFWHFMLANESRHLFHTLVWGTLWRLAAVAFGFTLSPFFASTFSAEVRRGVPVAHVMDDFLTVGGAQEEATACIQLIIGI